MNFKVGQKVVCVKQGVWHKVDTGQPTCNRPSYNDILTVAEIISEGFLFFREYGRTRSFAPRHFRPLDELTSYGINDLIETIPFEERKVTLPI